ncbi:hypothetical protein LTR53_008965 [Teratosphaeriaceae sp. CCFEE 6253]|nr:hypothetical protein LTR53_008965 [Teratosphaeriaceae sp. CCFEE 6253]
MGNCCGGESSGGNNFKGEGRTLNAQPANAPASTGNARAAAPSGKISAPQAGRTLGRNPQVPGESADPKAAAARAAEERAKAGAQGKGKLGRQLDAQRGQSQANALAQTARDNVAAREADAAAQTRSYN